MSKLLKLSGTCLTATTAALVGCQTSEPPPFDLRALQQSQRERSSEVPPRQKRPLPTTLESPFLSTTNQAGTNQPGAATTRPTVQPVADQTSEQFLRMPLQEIMHRAVANSLDVRVAGYQPAIDETRVTEAEARFDPVFFDNISLTQSDRESRSFSTNNGRTILNQIGIRQNLFSGGTAEARYETGYNRPRGAENYWDNQVVLEVTQPLLRDFGAEINFARISINRDNQRISLLEFRRQLETTTVDLERTYWQLVTAERIVRIAEQLLQNTIETGDILYRRMGQDVTRVQLSQANASIESRRAVLIRARARVRDLSDQLKRLMNDPEMPVSSGVVILPANVPTEEPIVFELQDQIDTALENRFELGQQQLRVNSADTALRVAKVNTLPQLRAVGSVSLQGLEDGFVDASRESVEGENFNYSIGLQFEIPIGNREARAIYRRAQLQRLQAIDQYRNVIEQVSLEVKTALREVETTWDEMVATRQARFAAEDTLLAINQREASGEARTPTFVQLKLDTQGNLADAQTREVEAVSNYNIAIARLEQAKGTLLRYNNIIMEEENLPIGYNK